MMYKKAIKYISMVVLIAFTITYVLPTQQIAYAQQIEQTAQTQKETGIKSYEKPKPQTRLGSFTDELYAWYEKLKNDLNSGDLSKLKTDIKDAQKTLKGIRKDIDSELSENEKTLQKLNAKSAQDRLEKFKTELGSNLDGFEAMFDNLDELSAALKELKGKDTADLRVKIEEIGNLLKPEQQQTPLGTLPHNNVSVDPPAPSTGAGTSAAYMGSSDGLEVSSLSKTPATEDLEETTEVKFTKEIKDLADSLNTSVKIYEYVRNNMNFEPYYGSRKGAVGTLQQMAGNDFDQASLLISMFRYKGIPSRYVRGTVEIPVAKAMSWTGAETPEAAVKALGSLGIPSVSMVSGGVISAVRMEHIWVEAYVPYENYRGVGAGTGNKIWVPLDPSFKQYEKKQGLNIEEITDVSRQDIESAFQHTGIVSNDNNAISRISTDAMQQKLAEQKSAIENYISNNNLENSKWTDIFGGYEIIAQKLGLLPLTLPYKTVAVLGEYQSISSEFKDTITFSISGADPFGLNFAGTNDFEYASNASEIYGKKITLSWVGATPEDESIINQYGGIFNTPAYMVQLKPVLKADGVVAATGKPVGMGYRQQFTIALKVPGQSEAEKVVNPVSAGSYYCVGLDYGTIAPDELNDISNRLKALQSSINEQNIYSDEAMGEILNGVAKTYFGQLDMYNKVLASQFGVKSSRLISEGMTGYNADVKYMFMVPVELSEGSMYIDVDRDVSSVVSLNGDKNSEKAFMLASGIMSSSMEHAIFEQMFDTPSVSSIKILNEANRMGIPVYTIDSSNVSAVIPKLEIASSVKTDIINAVNAGKKVTVPQRNIRYFDWTGAGYVVLDPDTGAAAYMISGGTAGGSMSIKQMLTEYVQEVIAGVLVIVIIELAEAAAVAFLPGAGLVAGAFMALKLSLMLMYVCNVIDIAYHYYETGNTYYLQELIVQLAAFATLGIIAKPISERITESTAILDRMAKTEAEYYQYAAENGYSREIATDYYQRYGPDDIGRAQDTLDAFKNEGVSQENVSEAGRNLDSDGIDTYRDIITDNSGKFNDSDQTEALDILEQCENKTEMDDLRSSIDELNEYGIKPSDYDSKGIETPETVKTVADTAEAIEGISDADAIKSGITDATEAEATAAGRPSWRQSELDFAPDYSEASGYREQASFKMDSDGNVIDAKYGESGSIRIDYYKSGHIVEIKNYNVTTSTGRSNLVNNIRQQYWQRKSFFPTAKQTYCLDVRGQSVTDEVLINLQNSIYNETEITIEIIIKSE